MSDTKGNRIAYLNVAEYALGKVLGLSETPEETDAAHRAYKAVFDARDALSAGSDGEDRPVTPDPETDT